MTTYSQSVVLRNELGLNLQTAVELAQTARQFAAEVRVRYGETDESARSVIGLVALGASHGARLTVIGSGVDALVAVRSVGAILQPAGRA